jgi:hypothetical protein
VTSSSFVVFYTLYDCPISGVHFCHLVLYHCFLCGGKTPESRRASLFAIISDDEKSRLYELTKDIKTLEAAISTLGQPDYEAPETETDITSGHTTPDMTRSFRSFVYLGLSETANIIISDRQEQGIKIYFQEKSIQKENEDKA